MLERSEQRPGTLKVLIARVLTRRSLRILGALFLVFVPLAFLVFAILLATSTTTATLNPAIRPSPQIDDVSANFRNIFQTFVGSLLIASMGACFGIFASAIAHLINILRARRATGAALETSIELSVITRGKALETLDLNTRKSGLADREDPLLKHDFETAPFPEEPLHLQVFKAATANPEAEAFQFFHPTSRAALTWTLGDLQAAALSAAERLREAGVCEDSLVALFLHDNLSVIIAILGTWCAGGAWMPIDRGAPAMWINRLLEESGATVVVADDPAPVADHAVTVLCPEGFPPVLGKPMNRWGNTLPMQIQAQAVAKRTPQSTAQVLYTSGSTGVPKGVIYSHRRLAHACHFFARECKIGAGTRVLQKTPCIWGVFRHEVWPALCNGGVVVVSPSIQRKDPHQLAMLIQSEVVEILIATPSILELIVDAGAKPLPLRAAICMGEGLRKDLAARIYGLSGKSFSLYNFYGSTETENTVFLVPRPGSAEWRGLQAPYIPAGWPQPHTSVHILDPQTLKPVLAGTSGEICFGGVMSDGYWCKPQLTEKSFVDCGDLGCLYRSGDLGHWRTGLGLQVTGRSDRQVKIRGIRVELEEVEAYLRAAATDVFGDGIVQFAAVAAAAPGSDNLRIIAFCAPKSVVISDLRDECQRRMPPYMVPSVFSTIPALPQLANGKVDLRAVTAMAEDAEETIETLDSLGMLRILSRAQVKEDIWIQNQRAFWVLTVMLQHFRLNRHVGYVVDGIDTDAVSYGIESSLGHGKDMVAFMLMVGFTDSRDPIKFRARDGVLAVMMLLMSGPLEYVLTPGFGPLSAIFHTPSPALRIRHGWFLYALLLARSVLIALHQFRVSPRAQCCLLFSLAFLFPDDALDCLPEAWRLWNYQNNCLIRCKGFRFSFVFMPACYLLGFHGGARTVAWARAHAPRTAWKVAAVVGASWTGYAAMSTLNHPPPSPASRFQYGYPSFQAVWTEESASHLVTFSFMTKPSFLVYTFLWLSEVVMFLVPPLLIAVAMAYCPLHFKTMGTTCFGNCILHPYHGGAPWTFWVQALVIRHITDARLGVVMNIIIVLSWSTFFCIAFAMTAGAGFHRFLVWFFTSIKNRVPRHSSRTAGAHSAPV
jgi:amino acid adenylation domain-containing protein